MQPKENFRNEVVEGYFSYAKDFALISPIAAGNWYEDCYNSVGLE